MPEEEFKADRVDGGGKDAGDEEGPTEGRKATKGAIQMRYWGERTLPARM